MEGNDPHGGHGQACEGEGGASNSCVLCGCLFSLSLCRSGFQDLLTHVPNGKAIFEANPFPYNTPKFANQIHSSYLPAYEDGTECSETSAYKIQTPGNYPEESIQHAQMYLGVYL